jgi:uncharacterized cupredoxin-like copper-binding protein
MRSPFLVISVAAILAISTAVVADPGHKPDDGHSHAEDSAWGRPGDPRQPARIVQITMAEANGRMLFIPDRIEVRRGEQIRFMLRNNAGQDHEFVLATLDANLKHAEEMRKNPDMEHDDPNAKRLASEKTGEVLWKFTRAGEFDFSCLIPGHRESGMFGKLTVK